MIYKCKLKTNIVYYDINYHQLSIKKKINFFMIISMIIMIKKLKKEMKNLNYKLLEIQKINKKMTFQHNLIKVL